jgi:hypothetical protein
MNQLFERFPTILAVTSFAVLVTTVVHEWGYFLVVGAHFQTLVSATDYLSNSILWLPQTLALLGVAYATAYALAWFAPPPTPPRVWVQQFLFISAPLLVSVVEPLVGIPFFLAGVVFVGAGVYLRRQPETFSSTSIWVALGVPLVLSSAFALGVIEAQDDLRGTTDRLFRIEDKDSKVSDDVNLLRSFDRGILVNNATEKRVEFIRWDEVRAMSIAMEAPKRPRERWPMCFIFKTCPSP